MEKVAVIGAGKFGRTIATLVSNNFKVLLYSRRISAVEDINSGKSIDGFVANDNIEATNDIQKICDECILLIPIVPSAEFRTIIKSFAPYLRPKHIIVHGIKGFDSKDLSNYSKEDALSRTEIFTMSEVIRQETDVLRIGALAGPNLSTEINENKPTAAVIASQFEEVVKLGSEALKTKEFYIFSSTGLKGTEIVGSLKNIYAIAAGIIEGLDKGRNVFGLLIPRAIREMIKILEVLGEDVSPAMGTAGLGDLVTTASSRDSRNFKFGIKIAAGVPINEAMDGSGELIEGARTLKAVYLLSNYYKIKVPIIRLLYQVVYDGLDFNRAINFLMSYPYGQDVDFL